MHASRRLTYGSALVLSAATEMRAPATVLAKRRRSEKYQVHTLSTTFAVTAVTTAPMTAEAGSNILPKRVFAGIGGLCISSLARLRAARRSASCTATGARPGTIRMRAAMPYGEKALPKRDGGRAWDDAAMHRASHSWEADARVAISAQGRSVLATILARVD